MKTLRNLFTALLLLCSSVAFAQKFEVDGIYYKITNDTTKEVEVTYKGNSYSEYSNEYTGNVVIPESVTYNGITYSVTSIGYSAFNCCYYLTSIEIPNSVITIGGDAFRNTSWYDEHPDGVVYAGKVLYKYKGTMPANTSIVIKEGTTAICSGAFQDCSELTSIEIPNSVTSIGGSAFSDCSELTSIEIPNSVTTIGGDAFNNTSWYNNHPDGVVYAGKVLYKYKGTMPEKTSIVVKDGTSSIAYGAFQYCSGLTSVVIPNSVTSIGDWAFSYCRGLTSIVIPNSVTSIGGSAFYNCSGLTSVEIPNSVITIGGGAFSSTSLTSIEIPNSVITVGGSAFQYCRSLLSVVIGSSVTIIAERTFDECSNITFFECNSTMPPSIEYGNTFSNAAIVVPDAAVDAYKAAWSDYAAQIAGRNDAYVAVDVEAKEATSGIMECVGIDKVASIVKLTVKGSINSYDVIQFRDKMPLLRELDLSEATVVASDKAFYNGNCTKDNDLGGYAFYNLSKLNFVKLPKDLVSVGNGMFYNCRSLRELEIPETVTNIEGAAFSECSSLKSIVIPKGVKSLPRNKLGDFISNAYGLFYNCSALESVTLPDGLENISECAFNSCRKLKEIKLPPTVKTIDRSAFEGCSSLEEIRIPSSVQSIGGYAFSGCDNLNKVYAYTVEPTAIQENTFSTFATATLYVPSFSFSNYYWDDGWKRFLNLEEFNEPYEYFYVNNDYTLNDGTGYIEGADGKNPDADINAGGGFIVEGEQGDDEIPNQSLGDVNVGSDGEGTSGSIIGDNNLHIDDLHIKITVKGGRWYFFAFPFDIFFKDISMENGSDYVFRYYDGEERANKGNGGWKDINENHLKAARGYIFQCSANDVLVLNIKDVKFKKEDKYNELVAHVSENLKDASWNFVGNPYLSYYDIADMDYTAPVTVWDGEKYVAIRPGDDDYHFVPYEAFFVQKPEEQESIAFYGEEQMTQNQSEKKKEKQSAARRARGIDPERQLINLVLGNGTSDDRTRIVFNERQSLAYETACDATKFSTAGVTQLYTIGNDKVHYAINERPADNGRVVLGYTAPTAGFYTIEAQRMDAEVFVKDYKTGTLHNLKDGAYSFGTDAGTFNDRFEILLKGTAPGTTGVDEVKAENGEGEIYDLQGRKMQDAGKGIYIIDGEKVVK